MNWKKFGAIASAVLLAFGMTGCGRGREQVIYSNPQVLSEAGMYPILKEEYVGKVKLKIMGANNAAINPDWSSNKFFQRMEEATGLGFEYEVYGDGMYDDKKSLALATGNNLPDVFFKANFTNYDEVTYGGKTIRSLNDLIDNYAPNIKRLFAENPLAKKSVTTADGNIYALPTIYTNLPNEGQSNMRGFFWINQKWMNDLHLEMPSTPEEFLNVLRRFKNEKCKGQGAYPLAIAGIDDLLRLFNFFGLDLVNYWVQGGEDGKIVFGPQTDDFKEAVAFLRTLYAEGLMNPNWSSFTPAQMNATGSSGDYYGCFVSAAPQYVVGFSRLYDFVTLDPIAKEGKTGFWGALLPVQRGCFAITTQCQYPEAAIRWIDSLYDLDAPYGQWASIGKEGEEWEWLDEEHTAWKSAVSDSDYSKVMATTIIQTGDGMPYAVDEEFWGKQQTASDTYTRPLRNRQMQYGKVGYPYVYFPSKELREISDLAADINSYVNRFIASSISTDKYLDNNWENFKQFKRLQLDRYLELLQIKYDEFYS